MNSLISTIATVGFIALFLAVINARNYKDKSYKKLSVAFLTHCLIYLSLAILVRIVDGECTLEHILVRVGVSAIYFIAGSLTWLFYEKVG